MSSTKPGPLVRAAVAGEDDRAAAVAAVAALAVAVVEVAAVAEAAVAVAGTVTAGIAAAVAAAIAAGNYFQQSEDARKPGSIEAPRFHFLRVDFSIRKIMPRRT